MPRVSVNDQTDIYTTPKYAQYVKIISAITASNLWVVHSDVAFGKNIFTENFQEIFC